MTPSSQGIRSPVIPGQFTFRFIGGARADRGVPNLLRDLFPIMHPSVDGFAGPGWPSKASVTRLYPRLPGAGVSTARAAATTAPKTWGLVRLSAREVWSRLWETAAVTL